jgi:glycosyltransferase involved in cell wall biosynthesis
MSGPAETVVDSAARAGAGPELSVLIPFFRDDPRPLLAELDREGDELRDAVEIVLLDDGTGDDTLAAGVAATVRALRLPTRFIRLHGNLGRALGRNRLAAEARANALLFLDSDMRPDAQNFLSVWLETAREGLPVVFGGFSAPRIPGRPDLEVARSHAARSDCVPASVRARQPHKHVYTSNLLVRREVFQAEAFAADFKGWGWEDTEWGMRVSRRWPIAHIDNTAAHLGLDTPEALVAKYEQSVANFGRVVQRHPDLVGAYQVYGIARKLKRAPGLSLLRRLVRQAALTPLLPVPTRAFALRLYRAALYAEVV